MKVNLNIEIDDDRVFGNIPESERSDEMRDYVRSGLEDFYGADDDNEVVDALLISAGDEIVTYLNQVRESGDETSFKIPLDESESEDWKLIKDGKPIAMGTQRQMCSMVKHHVPDGRYRLVGPTAKVHMIRENGNVGPDPDGVCLESVSPDGLMGD